MQVPISSIGNTPITFVYSSNDTMCTWSDQTNTVYSFRQQRAVDDVGISSGYFGSGFLNTNVYFNELNSYLGNGMSNSVPGSAIRMVATIWAVLSLAL